MAIRVNVETAPACWSWAVPDLESEGDRVARVLAEMVAVEPGLNVELALPLLRRGAQLVRPEADRFGRFHGGRCAVCALPAEVLDHCHRTGQVRGRLCRSCNVLEGKSGVNLFEAYRQRHPAAILDFHQLYHDGLWWIRGWPVIEYRASAWTRGPRPLTPWE